MGKLLFDTAEPVPCVVMMQHLIGPMPEQYMPYVKDLPDYEYYVQAGDSIFLTDEEHQNSPGHLYREIVAPGLWDDWFHMTHEERRENVVRQAYKMGLDPFSPTFHLEAHLRTRPPPLAQITEEESDDMYDLLWKMLKYKPAERLTIEQVLSHPWLNKQYEHNDKFSHWIEQFESARRKFQEDDEFINMPLPEEIEETMAEIAAQETKTDDISVAYPSSPLSPSRSSVRLYIGTELETGDAETSCVSSISPALSNSEKDEMTEDLLLSGDDTSSGCSGSSDEAHSNSSAEHTTGPITPMTTPSKDTPQKLRNLSPVQEQCQPEDMIVKKAPPRFSVVLSPTSPKSSNSSLIDRGASIDGIQSSSATAVDPFTDQDTPAASSNHTSAADTGHARSSTVPVTYEFNDEYVFPATTLSS